jgi:hypothetical protein
MKKIFYNVLVIFVVQACSGINESSESKGSTESKTQKEVKSVKDIKKEKKECSLDELLEMLYLDHERFDTYVLKKGYKFDNSEITNETGEAMVYTYLSNENNFSPFQPLEFRMITFSDFIHEDHWALSHCKYKTSEINEYSEFKSQLKQNGFVYFGSRGFESSVCQIYRKEKVDILLVINNQEINGETRNIYQIELILHRNSQ